MNETVAPETKTYPEGEYAIVELMGHVTLVGRVSEVQRYGTSFLSIEPIWKDQLLEPVLQGGASIYRQTSCSAEAAFKSQPRHEYMLPAPIRAAMPPLLLAGGDVIDQDDETDQDDDLFS